MATDYTTITTTIRVEAAVYELAQGYAMVQSDRAEAYDYEDVRRWLERQGIDPLEAGIAAVVICAENAEEFTLEDEQGSQS